MKVGNYKIKWQYVGNVFTHCYITNLIGAILAEGTARRVKNDHFCKDTGRKLSLARALKDAQLSKDERKVVWEIYRGMKPNKRW